MSLKDKKNYWEMMNFDMKHIPDLDTCVLGALEFINSQKLPKINIPKNKRILVVGSGNALVTGKIIFKNHDAIFASESDYENKTKNIDMAILISASGGKHAPIIAKKLKSRKIKTILFTANKNAEAKKYVEEVLIFPKQKEPYTYNTTTYLSMILASTHESTKEIYSKLKRIETPKLSKYKAFYLMVQPEFDSVREMFTTKFDELFGPMLLGRAFTTEQTKHAKTIIPSRKELFISFGERNNTYGKSRLNISLSKNAGEGELISIGYYIIGKIQKQKPKYFKKYILEYTKDASKIFGENISPIVE